MDIIIKRSFLDQTKVSCHPETSYMPQGNSQVDLSANVEDLFQPIVVSILNCYSYILKAQYCLFCVSIYLAFSPVMQCQGGLRNARGRGPEKAVSHSPLLFNLYTPTSPTVIKDKSELSKHLLNHVRGGRWFILSWALSLNSTQFPCSCSWTVSLHLPGVPITMASLALPAFSLPAERMCCP